MSDVLYPKTPTPATSQCSSTAGCAPTCPNEVFSSLRVLPTIRNGTRVEWELNPLFAESAPHIFELQVGRTGNNQADDWMPVGGTIEDAFFAEDDEQRVYGKTQWTYYRVCLQTSTNTHISKPVHAFGELGFRDRQIWLTSLKAWQRQLRVEEASEGFLLRRKLFGEACPNNCVDYQTFEITNPQCEQCAGTGFLSGYYPAVPCFYAALSQKVSRNNLDGGKGRGTVNDELRVEAKMVPVPQVYEYDVWVDRKNDLRWFVRRIRNLAERKGIPSLIAAELRLIPFSHPVYAIEMPAVPI